jgi:hypothetical protein
MARKVFVFGSLGIAIVSLTVAISAQAPKTAPKPAATRTGAKYVVPRTPWGDPDLQGIWPSTHMLGVPFERPANLAGRTELSDEELAQREEQARRQAEADNEEFVPPRAGDAGGAAGTGPPNHWGERGRPQRQTSLILEPADGRMPTMTPDGQRRNAAVKTSFNDIVYASPEDFSYYDRCISRGVMGSIMPVIYNNGNQIFQTPGQVVIRYEMIHETRVIPLDGRPHVGQNIRSYMGDARGRWEGDTLVVDTTNFNGRTGVTGNGRNTPFSPSMHLIERFTRVDADTIQYEAALDDPKTWTRPWKIAFTLKQEPTYGMFEYACHEGNNAMRNMLSGARAAETK